MSSYNKVILLGNLTRDPELRVTPRGTSICQFGIAVNREFKDEGGAKREEVTFIDVEAWGKQAELIAKYLVKGRPILFEGRLKLDQWDDKQSGQKRSKLKVVLEQLTFLPGGQDRQPSASAGHQDEPPAAPSRSNPPVVDEDVPF